jgi:GDP-D-mannose dehydratase
MYFCFIIHPNSELKYAFRVFSSITVKLGETKRIIVGNLTARRDWSYVQDIVDAYMLLAEKGERGSTYVIGSGRSYSIGEFIGRVKLMLSIAPPIYVSQTLCRKVDTKLVTNAAKIRQ